MAHPLDNKKLLEDLYLVKRLSLRQIEKKTNYSRRVVTQYIKKHNIPQRTHSASLSDQYTPFRFYLKGVYRARYKNALRRSRLIPKKGKCLTLPYLKGLWEKQNGTCPYTGIKLKLFTHSKAKYGGSGMKTDIRYASLDRIDSSKPYERGNVQFVAWPINYAKSDMSDRQMKRFVKLIRQKH
jgi:hypothetical protein|tara:strand:- start:354 stop:899 length:546 start_codon:yes stop_codon:yes gene_type:complete